MKKPKRNKLLIFLSTILSIFAVLAAVTLPLYYSVAGLLQPKTVAAIVQSIDYTRFIPTTSEGADNGVSGDAAQATVGKATNQEAEETESGVALDTDIIDRFIKTEAAREMLEQFAERLVGNMLGTSAEGEAFDAAFLKGLLNEHYDEIYQEAERITGEKLNGEELKAQLDTFIDENADKIIELIPTEAESDSPIAMMATIGKTVSITLSLPFILAAAGVVVLLFALIYLCRRYNYSGFIWWAVDCGLSALFLGALAVAAPILIKLLGNGDGFSITLAESVLSEMVGKLTVAIVVLGAIAVSSVVAVILLRKFAPMKDEISAAPATEE